MTIEEINHEISLIEPAEVNTRNVQVLASLYIIRNNLSVNHVSPIYRMPGLTGSELNEAMSDKSLDDILDVINELFNAVQAISPKLYDATIDKLKTL